MAIFKADDKIGRRDVGSLAGNGARITGEVEPSNTCAICKRVILPGSGRYRTKDGDVHEECYQERHGRKPPAEAR
jgi:hypothetical protein